MIVTIYRGRSLSSLIPIYAPGAHYHSRWMAKIIYTNKIVLFRDQLNEFLETQILIQGYLERGDC